MPKHRHTPARSVTRVVARQDGGREIVETCACGAWRVLTVGWPVPSGWYRPKKRPNEPQTEPAKAQ
jgi:hypothetical protein